MKKIVALIIVLFQLGIYTSVAQDRASVEKGIARSNSLVEAHNWADAFATLRSLDATIGEGNPELHYLVSKQRVNLYRRINRNADVRNHLDIMENYANASGDQKVLEDMLMTKASYFSSIGNQNGSRDCYKKVFQMRSKGTDLKGMENCFKQMIKEAKDANNTAMNDLLSQMYSSWQDSIASVRAAAELKELQQKYAALEEDLDSKESKITGQWVSIIFLVVLALGLAGALVFIVLLMLKNAHTMKKLRADLKLSNENNEQKSGFISNISKQINPSLELISKGNQKHIVALQNMLQHIEHYMDLETAPAESFETTEINVSKFCEDLIAQANCSVPVTTDAPKISFPIVKDVVTELIITIMHEAIITSGTERISLSFKKRNPHTGQFVLSVVGMKLTTEEKDQIFTAFAKVYDLSLTDGLAFPTCALMAHKMGGSLTLDPDFAKGTRFVLEVHC